MNAAEAALRARMAAGGGSVSFEEFMRFALYDPAHGYYSRRVRTVGRAGDFATGATLHPALGTAIGRWAARHRRDVIGAGDRWHLIELGGGTGEMADRVLDALGWWARRTVRYHVVEVSDGLRAAQRKRLARWGVTVRWHETLKDALHAAEGVALIVSNEFVDAFPCERWVLDERGVWREIGVAWPDDADQPVETVGETVPVHARAVASAVWPESMATMTPGQRVEVHSSYRRWLGEQFAGWNRGRMLTIDYGDQPPALYDRRPAGTLRAYCRQMRYTGAEVYARIGQQDLTADVNFLDLQRWGEGIGLESGDRGTQDGFLRRWLPARTIRDSHGDPALTYLLDPDGPGGAFRTLEQTRGLEP